jgi:hypothetical protein
VVYELQVGDIAPLTSTNGSDFRRVRGIDVLLAPTMGSCFGPAGEAVGSPSLLMREDLPLLVSPRSSTCGDDCWPASSYETCGMIGCKICIFRTSSE